MRNDIFPQDAEACRDLARYHEAQANTLRHHAYRLDQAELSDWRQRERLSNQVKRLARNGLSIREIANHLDISRSTAYRITTEKDKKPGNPGC